MIIVKRHFIAMILALAICFSLVSTAYAANVSQFTDLSANAWYMDYVPYMIEHDLMSGTSDTTFEPNASLTRAMFVTILGRIEQVDIAAYSTASTFSDVPNGQWYTPYVNWAADKGITDGTGAGLFSPNSYVSREQMATMIARYVNYAGITLNESDRKVAAFADRSAVSSYAVDAVELMRKTGIIVGDDNQNFNPSEKATRAQAATVFFRLISASTEPDSEQTTDTDQPADSDQATDPDQITEPATTVVPSEVWVTKSGKCYHYSQDCSNMKNPTQISIDEAKEKYLPCEKCVH
jgi:hypothetical protein